jgi:small subunit ribosomal protein S16
VLTIRLRRAGGRNHPFYRVVVIDSRRARDSRAVEELGYYNPLETPSVIHVDRDRVDHWTARGAQVSDSVRSLLKRENTTHASKRVLEDFVPDAPPEPKERTGRRPVRVEGKEPASVRRRGKPRPPDSSPRPAEGASPETPPPTDTAS